MTDTALATITDRNSAAPMNWVDNGLQVGHVVDVSFPMVSDYWWPPERHHHHYTTVTTTGYVRPNPTETAFKIVAKLMEDGLVEDLTVKKFVKLVDDVAKIVRDA